MNKTHNRRNAEKRQHQRYDFLQATFFRLDRPDAKPHECTVCNLSFGGLLMRSGESLEVGTPILIVLNLDGLILKEKVDIVHKSGTSDPEKNYGCRFMEEDTRPIREKEIGNFLLQE